MEKPTDEELAAALALADNGLVAWYCAQSKWNDIVFPMFKHCKKREKPIEAAARILAQAYRAELENNK